MVDLVFNPEDITGNVPAESNAVSQNMLTSISPYVLFEDQDSTSSLESSSPINLTILDSNFSGEQLMSMEDMWLRHSLDITIVYCLAYIIVFLLGLFGNSFVVAVVMRSPRMKTVTNYFIVNLACADILVLLFCMPATLVGNVILRPWVLGPFTCKAVSYLQGVSVSASINTLVAVSVDRFFAICYPLRCQLSTRSARRIICMIWIIALLITLPWAIFFKLVPMDPTHDLYYCSESWPSEDLGTFYFLAANLGLCYIIPLMVITGCYTGIWLKVARRHIPGETKGTNADAVMHRSKLKVVKMLVVVVFVFAMSWLPLYITFTRIKLGGEIEEGSTEEQLVVIVVPLAQWLGSSNSCINPLLYAFFNKKFRKGFIAIMKSRSCCGKLRYEIPGKRNTKTTMVLRSTFKSRYDSQQEMASTAEV